MASLMAATRMLYVDAANNASMSTLVDATGMPDAATASCQYLATAPPVAVFRSCTRYEAMGTPPVSTGGSHVMEMRPPVAETNCTFCTGPGGVADGVVNDTTADAAPNPATAFDASTAK